MATRTWNSGGSTNANDGNNYSPTGAIGTTDDLVLNNTSVVDWDTSAALTVGSVSIASTYTGNIWTGSNLTLNNATGFVDDAVPAGANTHYFESYITIANASGVFHIGSSLVANCYTDFMRLVINGTTGCTVDIDVAAWMESLTLGASAKCTISGAASYIVFYNAGTCLTMGNSSTLTINQETVLQPDVATNAPYSIGSGCTINGNSWLDVEPNDTGCDIGLPALTMTGTVSLFIAQNGKASIEITQNGNISIGSGTSGIFEVFCSSTNGNGFTFDHNDYNVTCYGDYILALASDGATTQNIYMGNGTFYSKSIWFRDNGGIHKIYWEKVQWTCGSNIDLNASCVHYFTSTARITQTCWANSNSFFTQNGNTTKLPYINLNASGKTMYLSSAMYCELVTIMAGTFNRNGYAVYATADDIEETFDDILTGNED